LFSGIDDAVAAQEATIGASLGDLVTFLSHQIVDNTITAQWVGASGPAKIGDVGGQGQGSSIAFLGGVGNTVTAVSFEAVQSASVGEGVGIHDTIITLLADVDDSISAGFFFGASGRATVAVDVVPVVTLFFVVLVDHGIATVGEGASGSASIGDSVAVQCSVVADFPCVNDTVAATEPSAVVSARVGVGVGISCTLVALLTRPAFESSISTAAGCSLRNLRPKSVQDWVVASNAEQDCDVSSCSGVGGMLEMNLHIKSLSIDGVFAWGVEFQTVKV